MPFTLTNPPPDTCPADVTALFALIRANLNETADPTGLTYVVQAATPAVGDQDKIWFKLDGGGRPIGIFKFYNGNWRAVYNGRIGEVKMFDGDPTGLFDGTGLGVVGGTWDGWASCNGQNGTTDLSNIFPVAANLNNITTPAYVAGTGWKTRVTGTSLATGGANSITLTSGNTYSAARPEIRVWLWEADGNTPRNGGDLYGVTPMAGVSVVLQAADAGNATPTAIPTTPPFRAFGFFQFVGYA